MGKVVFLLSLLVVVAFTTPIAMARSTGPPDRSVVAEQQAIELISQAGSIDLIYLLAADTDQGAISAPHNPESAGEVAERGDVSAVAINIVGNSPTEVATLSEGPWSAVRNTQTRRGEVAIRTLSPRAPGI